MKTPLRGRALRMTLILATATGTAALTAVGVAANAATQHPSSHLPKACNAKVHGSARSGHFGGIVRPVALVSGCQVHITSDAANGTPPLIWHKGPVMGTPSTGPVVITPIFWNPAGYPMSAAYKGIITTYLSEVAAASGTHTNVYSTLDEYFGSNGRISYQIKLGA